jgi:hypothetical protein
VIRVVFDAICLPWTAREFESHLHELGCWIDSAAVTESQGPFISCVRYGAPEIENVKTMLEKLVNFFFGKMSINSGDGLTRVRFGRRVEGCNVPDLGVC